jgi:hypothetical protein
VPVEVLVPMPVGGTLIPPCPPVLFPVVPVPVPVAVAVLVLPGVPTTPVSSGCGLRKHAAGMTAKAIQSGSRARIFAMGEA